MEPRAAQSRKDGDKASYTVRIRHLPTREEEQMLADQLAGKFGIKGPAVTR